MRATIVFAVLLAAGCDRADTRAAMSAVQNIGARYSLAEQSVHVLGDSFTAAPGLQETLRKALPDWKVTFDGVGGSSLAEQARRYQDTPEMWNMPVVILDGGLTDKNPLIEVERIAAHTQCWFYVEPLPIAAPVNVPGKPGYERRKASVDAIRAKYPDRFIPSIAPLSRHAASGDEIDLKNGWAPASLRFDRIHLNDRGYRVLGTVIANRVKKGCAAG